MAVNTEEMRGANITSNHDHSLSTKTTEVGEVLYREAGLGTQAEILLDGHLVAYLNELGLPPLTFLSDFDTIRTILEGDEEDEDKRVHPLIEDHFIPLIEENKDVESREEAEALLYHMYGETARYNSDLLLTQPTFWLEKKMRFEAAIQDILDYTIIERSQYDDLEFAIFEWLQQLAPRQEKEFQQFLNDYLANQVVPENNDPCSSTDVEELFGQRSFLIMQGPQEAVLAMKDDWNSSHDSYHPLDNVSAKPTEGDHIANAFWGPVLRMKHQFTEDEGEITIACKTINLKKLEVNLTKKKKFNDYPPNEIATHRCLQMFYHNVPQTLENITGHSSPYIVNFRGVSKQGKQLYYYMDYGKDYFGIIANEYEKRLKEWKRHLRKNRLKKAHYTKVKSPWEEERCKDFIKLARGLQYMHHMGIAHRDFKLENIVMGSDGNVKIIDFGVAFRFGTWEQKPDGWRCKDRVGTPTYMSPECTSCGSKDPSKQQDLEVAQWDTWDARANDIWTLGVALFMMICACPPYEACSNTDNRFVYLTENNFIPSNKRSPQPNASLSQLIQAYKRHQMCTTECINFMRRFFVQEDERITMAEIFQHPWLRDILEREGL